MGDVNYRPLIDDMVFSYSRIKSYVQCPYGWKLNYLDGFSKEKKFYTTYGSLMHKVLEKFFAGKISQKEMKLEFLTRFSDEVKGKRPSANVVSSYIASSLEYFDSFEDFDLKTLAVEKRVTFNIEGIPMTGTIDLIGEHDGDIYIIDHKSHELKPRSGRVKPTIKDQELDEYLIQLYLYSTAIYDMYGKYPKELWFNCFRFGRVIKEPFSIDKYNQAVKWVVDTVEKIKEDSDFLDNYDYFYCRWICDQAHNCEVYEEEVM